MRHIIDALLVGAVTAALAMAQGAPAGGFDSQRGGSSGALQIGLRINVDSDWISFKGTWSSVPALRTAGATTEGREITIGAVPNVVGRTHKGAALVRALRTTVTCVAKHIANYQRNGQRSEGK